MRMKKLLCIWACIIAVYMSAFCRNVRELQSAAGYYYKAGEYPKSAQCYGEILKMLLDSRVFDDDRIVYARRYTDSQLLAGGYRETEEFLKDTLYSKDPTLRINLAAALGYQERYGEALEMLTDLLREDDLPEALRGAINQNIGFLYYGMGNYRASELSLRNAVQYFTGLKRNIVLSNLALSVGRNGKFAEAFKIISSALQGLESLGTEGRRDYIRTLRKRGEIYHLAGRPADAKRSFEEYYRLEREWLNDNLFDLPTTMRLNMWLSEKQALSKCFILEGYDPEFLYEVAVFRRLTSLLGMQDEERLREALEVSIYDIRRSVGRHGAAIEFVTYQDSAGEEQYAAIVLPAHGEAKFVKLFPTSFVYEPETVGVNSIFNAIKRDSKSDKEALYTDSTLADIIWNPIIKSLPADTHDIYFAPEGILHLWGIENMPFEGRERYKLHRVTTTAGIKGDGDLVTDTTGMLLIGGLNYSSVPADKVKTEGNHEAAETLCRHVGTTNVFKYLPATRIEVDSIGSRFHGAERLYQAGEGELKASLPDYHIVHIATHGYSLNLGVRKRPEFMADSLGYDASLNACALALTGANFLSELPGREDGLLSAREICEMDLSGVDFVILSACQTAQGDVTDEGAAGLIRGLKNAGVKTVMATLWSVDDRSTMLYMDEFYRLLSLGKTKYDAYRGAQTCLHNYEKRIPIRKFSSRVLAADRVYDYYTVRYDSPYYWAPFILID